MNEAPPVPRPRGAIAIAWPPEIPLRFRKPLAPFTPYKDGWMRWYPPLRKAVHVCGKRVALEDVPAEWDRRRQELASASPGQAVRHRGGMTVIEALSLFYQYLDHRVATGQPKPLSETTRADYEKTLTVFARLKVPEGGTRLAMRPLAELGPDEFSAYAKTFAGHAPSTLARNIAYIQAFLRFCQDEGHLAELPRWGRYFVKPPMQDHRDARLRQRKSFTPAEIRLLWFYASLEEKLWMTLGLTGAFDNSDIAHLTRDVLDRGRGVIDFRRRKRGLMPRIVPISTDVWELLDLYQRPAPADPKHDDLFFLTPTGLPLARVVRSKAGKPHRIDYVSMCWARLLQRAGIRPAGPAKGEPDRRGFRSLRTSFSNLAPRGYRDEVELIMGHAGGVLLENYLEEYGDKGLRAVAAAVWARAFDPNHS